MKHTAIFSASAALFLAANVALAQTFGPGRFSKFAVPGVGDGVLVGASGVTWSAFSGHDYYGTKTFVNANIVDAEKTAARDDDDTWCFQIADMDALFLTGWARKTSFANVDAMKGHFNASLLRSASFVEGKYGFVKNQAWGDFFDWFKDETGVGLSGNGALADGIVGKSFASVLANLMGDGGHVLRVNVFFDEILKNPRWKGLGISGMSHGVLCVGYVASGTTLKALFIIDPDNDQFTGAGGASAPNSVLYCPVAWDAARGQFSIDGVWGQGGFLMKEYRALATMPAEGGSPSPSAPSAKATYKVKFVANGGKGRMAVQKMTRDKTAKLGGNKFKRSGYVFIGWARKKNGSVVYKDKALVKNLAAKGKTATLYAQWAKKTFKVKFLANGGKGKMAIQKFTYGKAKKLSANKFTRKGYTFQGWSKKKNGVVAYGNKAKVKNLNAKGKTVKLYAAWKKKGRASSGGGSSSSSSSSSSPSSSPDDLSYHVFFDANGGAGQMYAQLFDHDESKALSANAFERPGFAFAGWAKTAGGAVAYTDRQVVRNLSAGAAVWLYAVWRADPSSPVSTLSFCGLQFVTDAAAAWSATSVDGVSALASAPVGDNGKSTLYLTVTGPGTISFRMRISSEVSHDFLTFSYPGGSQAKSGGATYPNWDPINVSIPSGTHILTWTYSKDASGAAGSDCGWVADVVWSK